jgi:hypothetical protein
LGPACRFKRLRIFLITFKIRLDTQAQNCGYAIDIDGFEVHTQATNVITCNVIVVWDQVNLALKTKAI